MPSGKAWMYDPESSIWKSSPVPSTPTTRAKPPRKPAASGQIKLSDVASLAGVSIATVSRVINAPHTVREALRKRVEKTLRSLDYIPDAAARALASKRMNTIGVVVPTLGTAIFADWMVSLQHRLDQHGLAVLTANSEYNPHREHCAVISLINRGVDGMVLVGTDHLPETYKLLHQRGVPTICAYTDSVGELPSVGFNHDDAMRELARYVMRIGHREIGVITSPLHNNDRIRGRLQGIRDALAEVGGCLLANRIREVAYSAAEGRKAFAQLMDRHPAITAVMCTTDILAFGALLEATRLGYRVPDDVSITGFDDLELAEHMLPPLTTVRSPSQIIGAATADAITTLILKQSYVPPVISTELVIRGSSAPPRHSAGRARKRR